MFTEPLTGAEYQILVEHRFRNADHRGPGHGWALVDAADRVHGWHPIDRADIHWASPADAFKAFIADTRRRNFLTTLGWQVIPDTTGEHLIALLHRSRGEPATPPNPSDQDDDALALFDSDPTD